MIYSGIYRVTSPFGQRVLNGIRQLHNGVDVVGVDSKYVCAVVSGRVVTSTMITDKSNRTWEWGNYVRVDGDDGRQYFYCHLDKRLVKVGARVKAGDHIGIEGNTGYSFGAHCHFEVRNPTGVPVDPTPFLGIENKGGTYGRDYREETKARFGLSEDTMKHLDKYKFAADLYRKLTEK